MVTYLALYVLHDVTDKRDEYTTHKSDRLRESDRVGGQILAASNEVVAIRKDCIRQLKE